MPNKSYINHYQMKQVRKLKIKTTQNKCEKCGEIAKQLHHLDHTNYNHAIDNLLILCIKCHQKLHPSKYKQLYGFTMKELASLLHVNMNIIHHKFYL